MIRIFVNNTLLELEQQYDYAIEQMEEGHKEKMTSNGPLIEFDMVVYRRPRLSNDDLLELPDCGILYYNKGVNVYEK